MTRGLRRLATPYLGALLLAVPCATGCRSVEPVPTVPYVRVLGTAQDAGLPQIGCDLPCCVRARRDPEAIRLVASLLLVDPAGGRRFLFDATPDLGAQVELMRGDPPGRAPAGPRPPLFEGVFLTHAHLGHYTGLAQLGREAYGVRDLPVYASARMCAYLRDNGPWSLLVETGALRLVPLEPGVPLDLGGGLSVLPLEVPHREEFSDTLAFVIRGPGASALYLPDIDKWERWSTRIEDVIATVDVAYLDATFYGPGEVPGRDLATIPHPFVVETLERFAELPASERRKVRFLHLNHTNPLHDPDSAATRAVHGAGLDVARQGERFPLGPVAGGTSVAPRAGTE